MGMQPGRDALAEAAWTRVLGAGLFVLFVAYVLYERRRTDLQLHYQANHDSLTGLPNRALFLDRLERARARARRSERGLYAVLYLDLDRFKVVNDSLGHPVGDQVLKRVARMLEQSMRKIDVVARYGGEEFAIVVEGADAEAARNPEKAQRQADKAAEKAQRQADKASAGKGKGAAKQAAKGAGN